MTTKNIPKKELTPSEVRDFLKAHPNFLKENPDVMSDLVAPARDLGNGIIDFQHYLVKNLQKGSEDLKNRYDLLIDFCRDNMSVQMQVHNAALRLIRTKSLEQLLEVVTLDLVNLFDVDVVRLAMESDIRFDTSYGEQSYSGIVFISPGTIDAALGRKKNVLLVADCAAQTPIGFEQVFADCDGMIQSCALLRLSMDSIDKHIILAFGVRHKDRFHTGQGIELLNFLAQIVAHQLDAYLAELSL